MLGIDLTKISRFENANDSLIKRILHANEIKKYHLNVNKAQFLAKRWAIKEALYKADNSLNTFNKIELIDTNRISAYNGYEISTSHEGDYYIAVVKKEL